MKRLFLITLMLGAFLTGLASCNKNEQAGSAINNSDNHPENNNPAMSNKIRITVGSQVFTATLSSNATAIAFAKMLPLTLDMTELNANEKYFDFSANLPANASNPGTIRSGDLMLYGSRTFVLFYNDLSTTYSYTRLGKVDDASGLAAALGTGNVSISFRMD